jgi:hypothetical protein
MAFSTDVALNDLLKFAVRGGARDENGTMSGNHANFFVDICILTYIRNSQIL